MKIKKSQIVRMRIKAEKKVPQLLLIEEQYNKLSPITFQARLA